jgi:hypothetical protein
VNLTFLGCASLVGMVCIFSATLALPDVEHLQVAGVEICIDVVIP